MARTLTKTARVLRRVARDPRLLPQALRNARSRFTAASHLSRVDEYDRLIRPTVEAVATLAGTDTGAVAEAIAEPSLQQLLARLETAEVLEGMGGAGYVEVCYALVRLLRPETVLETGVAMGYSSAVLLHALDANGSGRLHSVDLPPLGADAGARPGTLVPDVLRAGWDLRIGPDATEVPKLLAELGTVDLFVYDSDKTYEGMTATWERVWPRLRPGAAAMFDDVNGNDAFLHFAERHGLEPIVITRPRDAGVHRWKGTYHVGLLRKPEP